MFLFLAIKSCLHRRLQLCFSFVHLTSFWWNSYTSTLMNTSTVFGVSHTLYAHSCNLNCIFTLQDYFLQFYLFNHSDCIFCSEHCQNLGVYSVLYLNTTYVDTEDWSCCCFSTSLLLSQFHLCRHGLRYRKTQCNILKGISTKLDCCQKISSDIQPYTKYCTCYSEP